MIQMKLKYDVEISHEFNIVPDDFSIEEGMLGRDFFRKFNSVRHFIKIRNNRGD